jgi:hypothetical protein
VDLLPDVDAEGVHPGIWTYLGILALEHRVWTGRELVVTSLRRAPGDRPSRHAPEPGALCTAADFRRWYLDERDAAEAFCRMLQARFGFDLAVVLEPEWLTQEELSERGGILKVQPHVHVQLRSFEYPNV